MAGRGQRFRQLPQLPGSVATLTSQPFTASPSQFLKFGSQLSWQTPAEQKPIELGPCAQTFPQAPQLSLESRRVSQPVDVRPSQSPYPALQLYPQVDALQVGLELGLDAHSRPQPPQFVGLVRVSTQVPPQIDCPGAQVEVHEPEVHTVADGQTLPQPPQLEFVLRLVSHPFETSRSQFAKPALHALTAHTRLAQAPDPFGIEHR